MHLCTLLEATRSYRIGLGEAEDDPEYINAVKATFLARDMLEQAGFVQIGRSNQSEACYLARPGSTHLRIRVAAHEPVRSASIEGVVASIVFVNRHTDDVREWGEIDGERILVGTRRIKHTGLDRVDVDELVQEAVKEYDAVRAAEENRTKPLATRNS